MNPCKGMEENTQKFSFTKSLVARIFFKWFLLKTISPGWKSLPYWDRCEAPSCCCQLPQVRLTVHMLLASQIFATAFWCSWYSYAVFFFFFVLYCSLFYLHIPSNSSHLITEIPQNAVLRCGCDGLWMLIYTAVQLVVAVVLSFKVALYSPRNQWCHPGCQSYPCGQVGQRLWPVPGAGCSPSQACLLCSWPWRPVLHTSVQPSGLT